MLPEIAPYIPHVTLDQVLPFLILILASLTILALDATLDFVKGMTPCNRDRILGIVTIGALGVAGLTFYWDVLGANGRPFLEGAFRADEFGNLGALVIIFAAIATTIMSPKVIAERKLPAGEMYALVLFATTGMTMLTVANELVTAFICIEILSLSLYVLAGIDRRSRVSGEAAFKYFILGAFASAFLVFGIAFLFGATGTTQLFGQGQILDQMTRAVANGQLPELPATAMSFNLGMNEVLYSGERIVHAAIPVGVLQGDVMLSELARWDFIQPLNPIWLFVGFALVFVGLCFKLSLAPFHMWAPDVYEGAPTISAMFIATASKVAAFAFLVHLIEAMSFWRHFPASSGFIISAVAVISIVWGNTAALVQTNIKRLLAYSSIAHGGYLTIGVATLVHPDVFSNDLRIESVRSAIIFYLFAYTLMNVLAFGIPAILGKEGEGPITAYRGLIRRRPMLAIGMTIAMVSLIGLGIPGTVGFWGKYYVFKEAINSGMVALAVIAMLGSAVSAYYYLRVVVEMFMRDESEEGAPVAGGQLAKIPVGFNMILALSSVLIFIFGFLPPLFLALGGR